MAELFKVNAPVRKPLFEGVQGENEARSIQFDIEPWVTELGDGAVTATAKRSQDSQPYPVTVTKDGNIVTWKPTSTDTAYAGVGLFQLEYTVDSVLAKTCIWSTMVAPSLDPAGDPPDPYDNWLAEMREIAADAIQAAQDAEQAVEDAQDEVENAEAWAVGQRGGVDVPSTDPTYENNSKYWAEQSLANQYGAYIVKNASGDIASFSDGADDVPMKSMNVTITPKQSGSGDPSPTNVRPITGWSTVNLSQSAFGECAPNPITGKNLFASDEMNVLVPCHIPASTAIVISAEGTTAPVFRYYDANKAEIDYWTLNQYSGDSNYKAITTLSRTTEYVQFTGATNTKFMIELGSTPTSYEPYGTTTPVPLGQTVYGANGDAVSGAWKKTKNVADLGSLSWSYNSTYGVFIAVFPNDSQSVTSIGRDAMCERYTAQLGATLAGLQDGKFLFNSTQISSGARLAIKDTAYTDAAAFKTAMDGVKFVYDLATPTDFTTTPISVPSLLGQNNVWSDAGAVEVEYRADPTLAYNELAQVIVSLGGNI